MTKQVMKVLFLLLALLSSALPISAGAQVREVTPTDHILGDQNAKITVIEYGSIACPPCAPFHKNVLPELTKRYIETGRVRLIYRPMMTGNPAVATAGHLLAACAGESRYFSTIDTLMDSQEEMDKGGPPESYENALPVLLRLASTLGMTETDFNKCITNAKGIEDLNNLNQGYLEQDRIEGTPTFFVNGRKIKGKVTDIATLLDDAIKNALNP